MLDKPQRYFLPHRLVDGTISRPADILVKEERRGKIVYRRATKEEELDYLELNAW
jgi:hypothetical protein